MAECNKNPKVSVITVCLNCGEYVESAIKSVLCQSYPDIEYIIIDGGSTYASIEIFNKYRCRIDRLVIEKDKGIFDAMNKGLGLASGDIIYFLNADDRFYSPDVVRQAVRDFSIYKEADFLYGNLVVSEAGGAVLYVENYPDKISRWLFINKTIAHPVTFFRSDCFKKAGAFSLEYRIAADYEWYLRAVFNKELKSTHVNRNISVFRSGGNSSPGNNLREYFNERILIQKRYLGSLEVLYTRILFKIKMAFGRRPNKFLHNLTVRLFKARNIPYPTKQV